MRTRGIVLTDIERIVPCMPGATLKEVVDESTYKGAVSIRLGPVSLTFDGTAKFEEIDETTYRAWVKTQGRDAKGRGSVMADVRFELQAGREHHESARSHRPPPVRGRRLNTAGEQE